MMSKILSRDIFASMLGVLSSVLGTIIVFVLASRSLGPELFGIFSFSYATASIMGLIFDFGYTVSLLRETAKPRSDLPAELPAGALWLKAALFIVLTPLAIAGIAFASGDVLFATLLWIGISFISLANFFSSMLRALGFHSLDAVQNFLANLAGILVAFFALFYAAALANFALVFLAIGAVYLGLTLRLWRRHCRLSGPLPTWPAIASELRKNLVYVLDAFGRRSFGFLDVAILGFFAHPTAVGFYQAAQKLTQGVSIFAQPLNNVILPRLAQVVGNRRKFREVAYRALVAQTIIGLLAGIVLMAIGPKLLIWFFSDAFAPATDLIPFFAALISARYVASALIISKTAEGFIRERLFANLLGVIVLLAAAPFMVIIAGERGLLVSLILSSVLGAVTLLILTRGRTLSK